MPNLDEVLEKVRQEGLTTELETELREATEPKWFRDTLKQREDQIAELKPKAENWDKSQRWPQVEKAFESFDLTDIPAGLRSTLSAFEDIGDQEKVANFAKEWGLKPKPEGQAKPTSQAGEVVATATDGSQMPPDSPEMQAVIERARNAKTKEEQQRILQEAGLVYT